jgi:hypothetical protein
MSKSKSNVWNTAPVPCNQCGRFYRADLISKCPGCAAISQSKSDLDKPNNVQPPTISNFPTLYSSGETTLEDLVRAQNRTTHAVRAFVRFLFIQLTGLTLVFFLWNLFLETDANGFVGFLVLVVWLGTVVWSSAAGWDELNKSNID